MISPLSQASLNRGGYTLAELIISIAIAGVIIIGIVLYMTRLQTDIIGSNEATTTTLALSEFTERLRAVRVTYPVLRVLDGGTGAFDAVILTGTGASPGYLLAGVSLSDATGELAPFEGSSSYTLHKDRVLALKSLTAAQITSLTGGAALTTIAPTNPSERFAQIRLSNLQASLYNTGAIGELSLQLFVAGYPELAGRSKSLVPTDRTLNFTLNF